MNFLLNFPWLSQAFIYLGIFVFGMIPGAFIGSWLRALVTKEILPDFVKARRKSIKMVRIKNDEIIIIKQRWKKSKAIIREMNRQLEEVMRH